MAEAILLDPVSNSVELTSSRVAHCFRYHGNTRCDASATAVQHQDTGDNITRTGNDNRTHWTTRKVGWKWFVMDRRKLAIIFTVLAVGLKTLTYIVGPLWLDYPVHLYNVTNTWLNDSMAGTVDQPKSGLCVISPYFGALAQGIFPLALLSIPFGYLHLLQPRTLTSFDWKYPKSEFWLTGQTAAVAALMLNYTLSGARTAPFLQALLGNILIPIQFTVRLLILRRRPTFRKFLCAVVVMVAEFICLLPRIFPALESSSDRQHDGGATGTAGILWPLAFVSAFIPGTMVNAFMERSVKDDRRGGVGTQQPPDDDLSQAETEASDTEGDKSELHVTAAQPARLNMVYYLFWYYLFFSLTTLLLFWSDIIPHYGTAASMSIFGGRLWFNLTCFFGQSGCGAQVVLLGWVTMFANFVCVIANANLLRYSEGANYLCIAMTLRSPILFLIWTLFSERRHMAWDPHASLSTWLSVGALCVMVPAVYIYNTGPPEKVVVLGAAGRRGAARTGPESSGLLDGNIQDTDDLN